MSFPKLKVGEYHTVTITDMDYGPGARIRSLVGKRLRGEVTRSDANGTRGYLLVTHVDAAQNDLQLSVHRQAAELLCDDLLHEYTNSANAEDWEAVSSVERALALCLVDAVLCRYVCAGDIALKVKRVLTDENPRY